MVASRQIKEWFSSVVLGARCSDPSAPLIDLARPWYWAPSDDSPCGLAGVGPRKMLHNNLAMPIKQHKYAAAAHGSSSFRKDDEDHDTNDDAYADPVGAPDLRDWVKFQCPRSRQRIIHHEAIGANLDRILVTEVKAWRGKNGQTQERITTSTVFGGRKIEADGPAEHSVGSAVDVANATWTNTIGAGGMIAVWKDPEFDPSLRAFYYVRVIEIPTPRWTAYDAKYFGVKMPAEVPMTTTERAYTSPIWYTP